MVELCKHTHVHAHMQREICSNILICCPFPNCPSLLPRAGVGADDMPPPAHGAGDELVARFVAGPTCTSRLLHAWPCRLTSQLTRRRCNKMFSPLPFFFFSLSHLQQFLPGVFHLSSYCCDFCSRSCMLCSCFNQRAVLAKLCCLIVKSHHVYR